MNFTHLYMQPEHAYGTFFVCACVEGCLYVHFFVYVTVNMYIRMHVMFVRLPVSERPPA